MIERMESVLIVSRKTWEGGRGHTLRILEAGRIGLNGRPERISFGIVECLRASQQGAHIENGVPSRATPFSASFTCSVSMKPVGLTAVLIIDSYFGKHQGRTDCGSDCLQETRTGSSSFRP